MFRKASEFISGKKYPTISASLHIYTQLVKFVVKNKSSDEACNRAGFLEGLEAAETKLLKFFDKSTLESEYYYIGTCAYIDIIILLPLIQECSG
jgi:hypothetical protein